MSAARDPSLGAGLILGLDASTTALGWAVLEIPTCMLEPVRFAEADAYAPTHADWRVRVDMIGLFLEGLLRAHPRTEMVGYETATGSHGNMRTNRMLGAVEWACWRPCWIRRLRFVEITASQVKASPFGKRHLELARGKLEVDTGLDMGSWPKQKQGHVADAMGVCWEAWRHVRDSNG